MTQAEKTKAGIIKKIQGMLDRADLNKNSSEAEAATAMKLAQRLLQKHGLEMADIEAVEEGSSDRMSFEVVEEEALNINGGTQYWEKILANAIAVITATEVLYRFGTRAGRDGKQRSNVRIMFCGEQHDAAVAGVLFPMLRKIIMAKGRQHAGKGYGNGYQSYNKGYARAVLDKANEQFGADDFDNQEEEKCTALMIVNKEETIAKYFDSIDTRPVGNRPRPIDSSDYNKGRQDGNEQNIDFKNNLEG